MERLEVEILVKLRCYTTSLAFRYQGFLPVKSSLTPVQINNYYISTKSIERKLLAISVKELKSEDSHKEFIRNFVNLVYYYLATSEKLIDQYSSFFGDDRINVITEVKDLELKRLLKPAYFNKDTVLNAWVQKSNQR